MKTAITRRSMDAPEFTASLQAKLPAGVTVAVSGDPTQGMVLTASASGPSFKQAEALLSAAFSAVDASWVAATA
jgi:hypothetical protein